jgi:hypothetical protein
MAITEKQRHQLFTKAEEVLGEANAETLMSHLPPVGWADVATKHDLTALGDRLELRFGAVDQRFDGIDQRFDAIDQRFGAIDQRFDAIDQRFDAMDPRFNAVEQRFDAIGASFDAKLEQFADKLRAEFQRDLRQQLVTFLTANAVMLGLFTALT